MLCCALLRSEPAATWLWALDGRFGRLRGRSAVGAAGRRWWVGQACFRPSRARRSTCVKALELRKLQAMKEAEGLTVDVCTGCCFSGWMMGVGLMGAWHWIDGLWARGAGLMGNGHTQMLVRLGSTLMGWRHVLVPGISPSWCYVRGCCGVLRVVAVGAAHASCGAPAK